MLDLCFPKLLCAYELPEDLIKNGESNCLSMWGPEILYFSYDPRYDDATGLRTYLE